MSTEQCQGIITKTLHEALSISEPCQKQPNAKPKTCRLVPLSICDRQTTNTGTNTRPAPKPVNSDYSQQFQCFSSTSTCSSQNRAESTTPCTLQSQPPLRSNVVESCFSVSLGQLFSDMIGGVAELLNSLLSLNCNSTLGEVSQTLMSGNRLFYLVLFFVMIMFVRRLLMALFLL